MVAKVQEKAVPLAEILPGAYLVVADPTEEKVARDLQGPVESHMEMQIYKT